MKRFKDILCVVHPESESGPALRRAMTLADNNQANLTVVAIAPHVVAHGRAVRHGPQPTELQAAVVREHEQYVEDLLAGRREGRKIGSKVLIGTCFMEVIREVLRHRRDLVIKAVDESGWMSRVFGSDDMHLLRKCPCPVWLVRSDGAESQRRIVALVDVDDNYPQAELETRQALNRQILEMAISLALSESGELHIVQAWDATAESAMRGVFMNAPEEEIVAYLEELRQRHQQGIEALLQEVTTTVGQEALEYVKPQQHLIKGQARKEIPLKVKELDADLIVMGTVARIGIPGFIFGNTAEAILNQIDCSVLAVKPPGFITPVTLE